MDHLDYQGLSKFQFLRQNRDALDGGLREVADALRAKYGAGSVGVSVADLWVITNCEGGITHGKIDPNFRHSLGEIGLFPLPANIRDWNGHDAPAWNQPMPIEVNVHHYLLYLGHLKNKNVKEVDGIALYRDLFRGHDGGETRNAKILAGVVHGYFYSGNYSDHKAPLHYLIDGYARDMGLADMMRTTKYVHAGTSIVSNREANIKSALDALAQGAGSLVG